MSSPHRIDILWVSTELQSAEHCILEEAASGVTISSTTLLPYRGQPGRIDYAVTADAGWSTQLVEIDLAAGDEVEAIRLDRIDEGWLLDGVLRPDLAACIDVDLGWTPATNLLPLRRAPIDVGETRETTSAWVRWPDLDVVASHQAYTRLAPDRVLYRSNTFEAVLEVTPDAIVTSYGDNLWQAASITRS